MTFRIIGLYLIPTFLLALIFPWEKASLSGTVFATALQYYGLTPAAHLFSFLVIAGAISCANSGVYATARSLHALCAKKMGPQILSELNHDGIPLKATLTTLGAIWVMLLISFLFSEHKLYANLLAISGFTGSMCWISICWSQLRFRKTLHRKEIDHLTFKIRGFPYLTHLSIWLQVFCLVIVAWSPHLQASFYLGVPALVLPMLLYRYHRRS